MLGMTLNYHHFQFEINICKIGSVWLAVVFFLNRVDSKMLSVVRDDFLKVSFFGSGDILLTLDQGTNRTGFHRLLVKTNREARRTNKTSAEWPTQVDRNKVFLITGGERSPRWHISLIKRERETVGITRQCCRLSALLVHTAPRSFCVTDD